MQFDDLVASISEPIFERLLLAVETGKWPDGQPLSEAQREQTMQLVIAYQARYRPSEEAFAVGADGQLVRKSKQQIRESLNSSKGPADIARFSLSSDNESV